MFGEAAFEVYCINDGEDLISFILESVRVSRHTCHMILEYQNTTKTYCVSGGYQISL